MLQWRVTANEDGTLTLAYPPMLGGNSSLWTEVEPLLFQNVDGDGYIAFREDENGRRITHMFMMTFGTPMALEKVSWYETKVVHVSTALVYGKPADCPFTEESLIGPVRFSEYARTKYAGDLIAWDLYENKGLPLVMMYLGAVLGPGDPKSSGRYIKGLIHRRIPARACEDAIMTYVHVRDVAEAIVRALEKENNIGQKYLVGKHRPAYQAYNELISEISGVPLPKRRFPNSVVMVIATLRTWLADLTKKRPARSIAEVRTMKEGFAFDGSKAERELGIAYTPVRVALKEAIASYQD
jgi:dihydroflavonol-4-reductase